MFGNGRIRQVVLKVLRVHHPKVPSPYLRVTMGKHLIVGASGQLGIELMLGLQQRYGADHVVLSDLNPSTHPDAALSEFICADATDIVQMRELLARKEFDVVYNLVAMLSAKGEENHLKAWDLNMSPLLHTLELAREGMVKRVFWPSSIAVFGPDAPKTNTPQMAALFPTTVYGVSKSAGELWCKYYHEKFGVDVRSIRYPGLVGFRSMPGGGTTDYAVDAFHRAIEGKPLTCYLNPDERLPMMTMSDAVRGTIQLMEAPSMNIGIRTSYNLHGCDFSPAELVATLAARIPGFVAHYQPDHRQNIAASWPDSLDDSHARNDWGWEPEHDLDGLVQNVLDGLAQPMHG